MNQALSMLLARQIATTSQKIDDDRNYDESSIAIGVGIYRELSEAENTKIVDSSSS